MKNNSLLFALICFIILIFIATIGYHNTEGLSWWKSFYLTMVTVTTIGYGDIAPVTTGGQIISITITTLGLAFLTYLLGVIITFFIEGHITTILGRKSMYNKIKGLKNHIIICGAGRVGKEIIDYLSYVNRDEFVVIDKDESIYNHLQERGILVIQGDATTEEVLEKAGINRAKGLVTSLPSDAENVMVILTARGLNKKLKIVARSNRPESQNKLYKAGADKVVSPSVIGGRRMAASLLKPAFVDFIDTIVYGHEVEFQIEEVKVQPNSPLANKTIADCEVKQKTGATIIAIRRENDLITNPLLQKEFIHMIF